MLIIIHLYVIDHKGELWMDIDTLSIEEKVGQLFMVNFDGTDKTGELIHLITYFKVGGLYYRNKNVVNLKKLHKLSTIAQNFAKTGLPLFLATTQEGENNNEINHGFTISPSQKMLGKVNNRLYTKQIAEVVAKELRAIGVNMNFSPVLNSRNDLNEESCFSEDFDHIAKHGVAAVQGYEKGQVCSVVKYFPDISPKNVENLFNIPIDRKKSPLYPFYRAVKYGASGVLVNHSLFESLQSTSVTEKLLNGILRDEAKFNGIIITEANESTNEDFILTFIEAGGDMILLQSNYEHQIKMISNILEAVKCGKVSEERINESVKRILSRKEKHQVGEIPPFNRESFQRKWSINLVNRLHERAKVTN